MVPAPSTNTEQSTDQFVMECDNDKLHAPLVAEAAPRRQRCAQRKWCVRAWRNKRMRGRAAVCAAGLAVAFAAVALTALAAPHHRHHHRRRHHRHQPAAAAAADAHEVDEACVDHAVADRLAVELGSRLAGWRALARPAGASLLLDRGALAAGRPDGYDWRHAHQAITNGYDAVLADVKAGGLEPPSFEDVCDVAAPAAACAEACLESRFRARDGFERCSDGARAAFLLAPDLVKACLTPETSCYECVASCGVAAESCRPVRVARSSG